MDGKTKAIGKKREPLFHIVKKTEITKLASFGIHFGTFILAIIICGIISASLTKGGFGSFLKDIFDGVFGTSRRIKTLLLNTALLLVVALAVTPAFKMRFWNIGAEGQILIGGLCCAACMFYGGGKMPDAVLSIIMFFASVLGGAVWAVIPAIFKALWKTNETLFTLMMNYLAACLTGFMIKTWAPKGSGVVSFTQGGIPELGDMFTLPIIIVAIVTFITWIYLRFSKHGYELAVVGESENTAKYIGINVKKTIIRTLILSGIICGIAGFLLVGGVNHNIHKTDTVAGRGFTAILVSWLAKFNPFVMVVTAFLVIFITQGTGHIASLNGLGTSYSDVMIGIFFFLIIACEFFVSYKVVFDAKISEKWHELKQNLKQKLPPLYKFYVVMKKFFRKANEFLDSAGEKVTLFMYTVIGRIKAVFKKKEKGRVAASEAATEHSVIVSEDSETTMENSDEAAENGETVSDNVEPIVKNEEEN